MTTVISCYPVPRDAAPPVLADDGATTKVLRAISDDAPFGYLTIAEVPTQGRAAAAVAEVRQRDASVRTGAYEAFHSGERAAPPFAPDAAESSVMFVNCMQFAPDRFDAAFALWRDVNAYMVRKPGYRWHRLHRRAHDDAPFGLVNVVEWESVEAWRAAHDAGFRERAVRPEMPMIAYPTLCLPVPVPDTAR